MMASGAAVEDSTWGRIGLRAREAPPSLLPITPPRRPRPPLRERREKTAEAATPTSDRVSVGGRFVGGDTKRKRQQKRGQAIGEQPTPNTGLGGRHRRAGDAW
ncbi:hypothetical protein L596_024615 [Steinernema carpocapsae]|uniref:Uncharacterized protein n=1 Tax=Steinernema carpocapsae TaxID=34508 RepID=A0A4U5M585_STECR|nr:hypothetical protein L596_024615 [Steinernema carpocapsae]